MHPELTTFFTSMTPFLELKLAIPLGMEMGLSQTSAILIATAGSLIPAALSLALLGPASDFLRKRSKTIDNFFTKLFHKTRHKHSKKFQKYGSIFVLMFVAIPLPGSGSSMGSVISFLFGVEYWKAFTLITIGTVIAAGLVSTGTASVFALLDLLKH